MLMMRYLATACLALVLLASGARAQAPFYTCQITIPNPPSSTFPAPGPSPTICGVNPLLITAGNGAAVVLNFSTGAVATVSVQVTGDQYPSGPNAVWNDHDYLVNETSSANSNIVFPVTAVRLYVSAYTSGTITLYVVEAGK
jgi:hypothetical protein